MTRAVLGDDRIHSAIRARISGYQQDIIAQVQAAVAEHPVVVVGMRQNPYPRRARQALDAAGIAYHYLEYGSYLGMWRERLALKMWTGWPTLPMIFVKGVFVGGCEDMQKLLDSGELRKMLG